MREAGVTVTAHQVTLSALFDGRSDVVQTHGALQQGEETGGVHQPQLQVGLLHQDRVHPDSWWFLQLGRNQTFTVWSNCKNPEIETQ